MEKKGKNRRLGKNRNGSILERLSKNPFQENYGWQIDNVQVFDEPIDAKGHLSLWEYKLEK